MENANWRQQLYTRLEYAAWFLRPTIVVVIAYCITLLGVRWWYADQARDPSKRSVELTDATAVPRHVPNRQLTVEDVVRIQLAGLQDTDRARGICQCFAFASPANRIATGPLVRFADMIAQPPYHQLHEAHVVVVGRPVLEDTDTARVLVVAFWEQQIETFVWILTRQTDREYSGCWMTDSVLLVDHVELGEGDNPAQSAERPALEA